MDTGSDELEAMSMTDPHRLCLRCDWEGPGVGPACPECGAPLYEWSGARPDWTSHQELDSADVSRPAPLIGGESPLRESSEPAHGRSFHRPARLLAAAA